ncbi:MAG: hypothetical protein ACI9U2_001204 [Bradymonadia bacterium]|jgi:hypothetical protein
MPWPLLPPNPETQPAPFDGDLFVFSLELTGMYPPDEQVDHHFSVDGVDAAVYVPIQLSASDHVYTGVGIAPLTSVGSTVTYKSIYLPRSKENDHQVDVDASPFLGGISKIEVVSMGSETIIKAVVDVSGSGWSLFAVPFMPSTPKFASLNDYQALVGHADLSGSGIAKVTVTPGSVERYAVFVGRGWPTEIVPDSAAYLIEI